ncbi:odorant receptor 22c-like [Euwallacea fornicatus]|uniref:odorant receptor 22c-like n=1 Tax=Euwallacea fornicatus TaxID=995702 RepID=UPI00338D5C1C
MTHAIMSSLLTFKHLMFMAPNITTLLKMVTEDEFVEAKENLKIREMVMWHKKFVWRTNIFFIVTTYVVVYCLTPQEVILEYLASRQSSSNETELPERLILFWVPFDKQKYFYPTMVYQLYLLFQIGAQNYASLGLQITLITYIILKFKILRHLIRNFNKDSTSEADILRVLGQLSHKHQIIIDFVQKMHTSFKLVLLIEYSASSLILASATIQIIQGNKVAFFLFYECLFMFQLFLLSWKSEQIKTQSLMVGTTLYESDWYLYNTKVRRIVLFMMLRSNKALTLNIGPFGPNTMEAAMTRVKLGYSYVTLMSS